MPHGVVAYLYLNISAGLMEGAVGYWSGLGNYTPLLYADCLLHNVNFNSHLASLCE